MIVYILFGTSVPLQGTIEFSVSLSIAKGLNYLLEVNKHVYSWFADTQYKIKSS